MGRSNEGHYTTIGRETALDSVKWLDDGWFIINDRQGRKLKLVINRNQGEELIASVDDIKEQSIYLKVVVKWRLWNTY
jgi:beta-xylosidase